MSAFADQCIISGNIVIVKDLYEKNRVFLRKISKIGVQDFPGHNM